MTKKQKKQARKIICALILFAILMILEQTDVFSFLFGIRLISFGLYLVPYLIVGLEVLRKAALGIKNRQPFDECFLMTLATIGAFATGENSEAVAVMLFYQVGEWFQGYAVGKSRESITELMNIVPEYANIEHEDGSVEEIDPDDVEIGDTLVIKPGEKIPVDGMVLNGAGMIDTAALTGESLPRSVHPGEAVISGCINGESLLKIRAEKAFEDSTVSKILELVENASEKKSRTESFITRFARWYTPIVVIAALVLAIAGSLITMRPGVWIYRACTFLVISCPCALVISVPLSFFGGIGAASKIGVLVKGSNYLEQLSYLQTVVTDKTGTLTEGNFKVSAILPAEGVTQDALLTCAAIAENTSTHPIALSVMEAFRERFGCGDGHGTAARLTGAAVSSPENISGKGIRVTLDGEEVLAGNARLLEEAGILCPPADDPAAAVVYISRGGTYLGMLLIRDQVKAGTAQAISDLKSAGVSSVVMLTGDRTSVARAVADEVGVDRVFSELLPQQKVEQVEHLLDELHRTSEKNTLAFLGDGINDAPVLSRADIGVAMGSLGSDAAIEAADIVIMDDDLRKLPATVRIARRTVGICRQNIVFALAVKAVILLLGAVGIANMWAAVFADVGVAILCILNAMRVLYQK